jgi:hypothetical protein
MSKVKKLSPNRQTKDNNYNSSISLDKLETTSDYFFSKNHESQYRTAIHKYNQNKKLTLLMGINEDNNYWRKQYQKSFYCNHIILQNGNTFIGSLCRKRWCQICNRIKTAELINGYYKPLKKLQDEDSLYSVTLTAPTCKERELKSQIRSRLKTFIKVKDNMRKRYSMKLNGYRKVECAYNEKDDRYHPHLHLIVQGYDEALKLRELWLKSFSNLPKGKRANIKAQDIQLIQDLNESKNGLKETFKYATKGSVKDDIQAHAEDVIHKALKGTRIYQPYGKIRKVKEPKEKKTSKVTADWLPYRMEIWEYSQHKKDWFNARNESMVGVKHIEPHIKL